MCDGEGEGEGVKLGLALRLNRAESSGGGILDDLGFGRRAGTGLRWRLFTKMMEYYHQNLSST